VLAKIGVEVLFFSQNMYLLL